MNELEFLRGQLRLERTHYQEQIALLTRGLCSRGADVSADRAIQASAAYLVFAARRSVRRNHLHARQLASRLATGEPLAADEQRVVDAASQRLASSTAATQTALEALVAALATHDGSHDAGGLHKACAAFAETVNAETLVAAETLDPWVERLYNLGDWRCVALTDAESVFEERRLYDAAIHAAGEAGLLT